MAHHHNRSHGASQGTAVIAGAVSGPQFLRSRTKTKGVVLFGYTRNQQNNSGIPDFQNDNIEDYCADGESGMARGTLVITGSAFYVLG